MPAGVLRSHQVTGRTTAAPLRSGEPVTDARLVHGSLLAGYWSRKTQRAEAERVAV